MDLGATGINGNENKGYIDRRRDPMCKKAKELKWEDRNEDTERRIQSD